MLQCRGVTRTRKPRGCSMIGRRTFLGLAVSGLVVTALAAGCSSDELGADEGKSSPASSGDAAVPDMRDYGYVSLPEKAPAPGAFVSVSNMADPNVSGQHLMFQYQDFTIGVCAMKTAVADKDACDPQPSVTVLRKVNADGVRTIFTISTKQDKLSTEAQAAAEFFRTTGVVTKPAWLPGYAKKEYYERYGS